MKSIRDNTRRPTPSQPRLVDITITVTEERAFWLVVQAEANGITPQRIASQIVTDVIDDDVLAHSEAITLQ